MMVCSCCWSAIMLSRRGEHVKKVVHQGRQYDGEQNKQTLEPIINDSVHYVPLLAIHSIYFNLKIESKRQRLAAR